MRAGSAESAITVHYRVSGNAVSGQDFEPLTGSVIIPAGKRSATIVVKALPQHADDRTVILTLETEQPAIHVGCPSASLVVIRR